MTMAKLAAELKLNYEILPVLLLLRRCLPRRKKRRKMLPLSPPKKPSHYPPRTTNPIKILMRTKKNENDEKK